MLHIILTAQFVPPDRFVPQNKPEETTFATMTCTHPEDKFSTEEEMLNHVLDQFRIQQGLPLDHGGLVILFYRVARDTIHG